MKRFGNKNSHLRRVVVKMQRPLHMEFFSQRLECPADLVLGNLERIQGPLDPHEKGIGLFIDMLISVLDVAGVLVDEIGDCRGNTFLIKAGYK